MDRIKQLVFTGTFRCVTLCLVVNMLFVSCSKESVVHPGSNERPLRFELVPHDGWNVVNKTRAIPVTSNTFHSSFGVYAGIFSSDAGWTEDCNLDFMWNVEVGQESGSTYKPESPYYLPGEGKSLRFFAYAPYGSAELRDGTTDGAPDTWTGTPVLRFEVQADVTQQVDLCIAQSENISGNGNGIVPLEFYHALVGVRFVTGTVPSSGIIRNITLTNIRVGAHHRLATESSRAIWGSWGSWYENGVLHGGTKDLVLPLEAPLTGAEGIEITKEAQTFMLIPDSPLSDSFIEVLYDPDGEEGSGDERTLTARIGNELGGGSMGKIVTYRLSIVNDALQLTSTIAPWTEMPPISGGAEKPVPAPEIGDFYYSDGTWSSALDANKTVIGIVFQTDPARIGMAEREALAALGVDQPHGLVMALKDASTSVAWATKNSDIAALTNSVTLKGNYDDYSGFANCNAVRALDDDFSDYPAFMAACVEFAKQVPPPANTTGWYLPAFGQWWDIFTNVAGASLSSLTTSDASNSYLFSNTDMSGRLNANVSLSQIAADQKDRFTTATYASSTEVSDAQYCSWSAMYIGSAALGFNRTAKSSASRVRAVLAF